MYYVEMTLFNGEKRYLVKGWNRVIEDWTKWTMDFRNGYKTISAAKSGIGRYLNSRYLQANFPKWVNNPIRIVDLDGNTISRLNHTETKEIHNTIYRKHKLFWKDGE